MKKYRRTSDRLKALRKLLRDKRPRSALEASCIQRQVCDLEEGHKRGLVWDEDEAQRAVAFFGLLRHWKGKWAGLPLTPESWQEHCIIAPLFGWKLESGMRRFRTAYIEVPRKQGKTTIAAGFGLQGLMADNESGAEVYAAATKRDQATILFNDAKKCMGPRLRQMVKMYQFALNFEPLSSVFKPLSSDHDSLDGLNVHRAIIDELHAHKERGLWDVIMGAVGSRSQPLVVAITTAGDDDKSICGEVRNQLAIPAANGGADSDDSFFAFIACADLEDDWQDPATWAKANPNLGVSLNLEFLENLSRQARASKASENNFRRKHLNQWITGASEWIKQSAWTGCATEPRDMDGNECFIGVDIGTRDDFASIGRVFPKRVKVEKPQKNLDELTEADVFAAPQAAVYRVQRAVCDATIFVPEYGRRDIREPPLVNWIDRGLIRVAGGNSTDFEAIMRQIEEDARRYNVRQIAIDPNNTRQLGQDLVAAGFDVFDFVQNTRNYHEPMTEFGVLVSEGRLEHFGSAVLSWMIGNVRMRSRNGYVMPWKDKSPDKIDGPVSLLMAMGAAMFAPIEQPSIYETEGAGVL